MNGFDISDQLLNLVTFLSEDNCHFLSESNLKFVCHIATVAIAIDILQQSNKYYFCCSLFL